MATELWAFVVDGRLMNYAQWDSGGMTNEEADEFYQHLYKMVRILDGVTYGIGAYYNPADGLFYADAEFQHLYGWVPPPNPLDPYNLAVENLPGVVSAAITALKRPYSDSESESWSNQLKEAEMWTADNSYVPVMLNAMVSASNGEWTLPELVSSILSNAAAWKVGIGEILGRKKVISAGLTALKAKIDAGTATYEEARDFDYSIETPSVNITDKFA